MVLERIKAYSQWMDGARLPPLRPCPGAPPLNIQSRGAIVTVRVNILASNFRDNYPMAIRKAL